MIVVALGKLKDVNAPSAALVMQLQVNTEQPYQFKDGIIQLNRILVNAIKFYTVSKCT